MDIQTITQQVTESTNDTIFGVWFMIAVALVFKPYGLLYRYSYVHTHRLQSAPW